MRSDSAPTDPAHVSAPASPAASAEPTASTEPTATGARLTLATPDPWSGLRRHTSARIALGRVGGSQPTAALLDFRLAHARARDAVLAPFDPAVVAAPLAAAGLASLTLASGATDRRAHLLRPDLGRRLDPASRERLAALATAPDFAPPDLVCIISDGLAAAAAERHAAATLVPLAAALATDGWRLAPILLVPFARVKLQDEIGALLRARYTLMLLGERPGLGAPDSLGAYFTRDPAPARTDADRNCVSNIRPEGLPPASAAATLARLLKESARRGVGGVALKDDATPAITLPPPA